MIVLALVAQLSGASLGAGGVAVVHGTVDGRRAAAPVELQAGLGSCADPWGSRPALAGALRQVHPDVLRERFAPSIVQRDWGTAVAGYASVIDTTLAGVEGASSEFARLRTALGTASRAVTPGVALAVSRDRALLAGALADLEVNQFKPVSSAGNRLIFLQSQQHPNGVVIDTTAMRPEEVRALCSGAWSLYRLLQNINFETIPAALVRIEAQSRRWERYRANGPMQLPHELVLNRIKRGIFPASGSDRFNPPRLELVALHPFGGIEFSRTDEGITRTESMAVEVGGFTWWMNDWRQHLGASWVLAYDADGRIGRGPLLRVGGYVTGGWMRRRDANGVSRSSVLLVVDALRLLRPDAAPQALRQAQQVAGEILKTAP